MKRVLKRVHGSNSKRGVSPLPKRARTLLFGFDKLKPAQRAYFLEQILKQAGPRWRLVFGDYIDVALAS